MVRPRGVPLHGDDWSVLAGRRPAEPPSVSVIVAHYEQQAELDRTLSALSKQTHPASRLEIVVVDDGSASPPHVPDGVRLVVQQDRGFRLAAARNAGAAVARGDVLCFLDADTSPEPDYVSAITRLPSLAPDVVAVGRRRHADLADLPVDVDLARAASARELPEPAWLTEAYDRTRDLLDGDSRSYRFMIGAVVACSAGLFAETGGFDESFDSYGGEDWEWAYRAWLRGASFAHVREAVAWHDGPEWSGRPEAGRERKNAEAMRLARLIPVPGSGPQGLPGAFADVAVTLPPGSTDADPEWFVTLDSIAAALPTAALAGDARPLDRVRVVVDVERPCRVTPSALGHLMDRMAAGGLGALTVTAPDGGALLSLRSTRAAARGARWGRDDLFDTWRGAVEGVDEVARDVDVEGYLGGWA